MSDRPIPQLTQLDAMVLDGLVARRDQRWLRLDQLIDHIDWLDRWVPDFDEISYGLPRLIAAGHAEVRGQRGELMLRATPRAIALARANRSRFMGDAVGARPWGEQVPDDRTLGRLPGLDEATWDAAVRANREAFDRALSGLVTTGCLIAVAAVVGVVSLVWSRLRRRRPG